MKTLVVYPTPTAEWQALVKEAGDASSISLTDDIESYLIFLLMRFAKCPEIAQSVLAIDFLNSLEHMDRQHIQNLRDVGDKCLLFAGLFPGRARRRRVRISYYVNLGKTAYASISAHPTASLKALYASLDKEFVLLMDILHTMRELNTESPALDLLQAEELWNDTRSPHALQILRSKTQGLSVPYLHFSNQIIQKH